MWSLQTIVESDHTHKHSLRQDVADVSYGQVLDLWQQDRDFCQWWIDQLLECPWKAVRWETPCLTASTLDQPFEFVMVACPSLDRPPSARAFAEQFRAARSNDVIAFQNLGRNAVMVVPTPMEDSTAGSFCHLMSFLRSAGREQAIQLWNLVGLEMAKRVGRKPVWLSTAGGGVAWLHVRLDDRPKYYSYHPYRTER